jgi:hypothetical protein
VSGPVGATAGEREGREPEIADAGDIVGIAETLGGFPFASRAEVVTPGNRLRFARTDVFALLADNIDLLQGIFSGRLRARTSRVPGCLKDLGYKRVHGALKVQIYDVTETQVQVLAIVTKAEAQTWLNEKGARTTTETKGSSPGGNQG